MTTLWSHDGSSVGGAAPSTSLELTVRQGHYQVLIGDTSLMQSLPDSMLDQSPLSLRVWFDDGTNGESQLSPDFPITSVMFAMKAQVADSVKSLPDKLVALQNLNDELRQTLDSLKARLDFLEQKGGLVSSNASDQSLTQQGYVLYGSSSVPEVGRTTPSNLPSIRTQAQSVASDAHWLVWGGRSSSGIALNTGSWRNYSNGTWTAVNMLDAPAARYDHLQLNVGGRFFIQGGQGQSQLLQSAALFDPASNQWTPVTVPNDWTPRRGHSGVVLDDGKSILLFGGRTSDGLSSRFAIYNTETSQWDPQIASKLAGIISTRQNARMARVGTKVILWGGENETGPSELLASRS